MPEEMRREVICNVMCSAFIPQVGLAAIRGPKLFPPYHILSLAKLIAFRRSSFRRMCPSQFHLGSLVCNRTLTEGILASSAIVATRQSVEKVRGPRLPSLPPGLPFRVVFPRSNRGESCDARWRAHHRTGKSKILLLHCIVFCIIP